MKEHSTDSVIDLFAGSGGLSLGFSWSGFKLAYALEEDVWAAETYRHNFANVPLNQMDIRDVSDDAIRSLFLYSPAVVMGGPPCQGFSHSNSIHRDATDPRNSLFHDFLRFVKVLRPRFCVIENVKGLLTSKTLSGSSVIDVITSQISALGYQVDHALLNAKDYGIPQNRERLFVVGWLPELGFAWPAKSHRACRPSQLFATDCATQEYVTLWDAISDLPQHTHSDFDVQATYRFPPANAYQAMMRNGASESIENHEPMRHTPRVVNRFAAITFGQSEADVPAEFRPRIRGNPKETSSSVYGQNSRRQYPSLPCNTLVASSHTNFIHPFLNRNFTVREMLRIQSFPDSFVLKGKRAVLSKKLSQRKGFMADIYLDQRMQVGNAVPPLLAYALAKEIQASLSRTNSTNSASMACS